MSRFPQRILDSFIQIHSACPTRQALARIPYRDQSSSNSPSCPSSQVDSCISKTIFPVLLGPLDADNASAGESLKLVIVRRSDLSELLYLEQISVGVQPLRLSLEQNTLTRLLRLADSISISAAQILTSDVPYEASDAPADAPSSSPPTRIDSSAQRIYVKQLRLHPLVVNLTVQLAALTDEPALQPFHPTNKLVGLAKNIASINKATLRLDALHLDEANLSPAEWAERLGWHYTLQLLQSVYKLLGSLDFLGNPAAVFADVRGGFRAFFYEPSKGLVQSPVAFVGGVAKGTRGLAGGVAGGVSAGFMGVFSTGFKHVGTLAGGLALDPQFERNFEQACRSHTRRVGCAGGECEGDRSLSSRKAVVVKLHSSLDG